MNNDIQVDCLYFASLKAAAGTSKESVTLPSPATVEHLLHQLERLHPDLKQYSGRYQVAVQQEMVDRSHSLEAGDEVALIPPVSGGAPNTSVRLMSEPIDAQEVLGQVMRPDCGAVVLFLGTVRDFAHAPGQEKVEHIDYSAYEPMAEKELLGLVEAVQAREPLGQVAVWHRTGVVAAGQASVAVAVSACHRQEAFAGARWLIDELKARVPVWKKEVGPAGEVWIEGDARIPANTG